MLKKYSDYIEISPNFESVVDIGADTRKPNLWRDYIVGEICHYGFVGVRENGRSYLPVSQQRGR